ncbi:MAG: alanine racemase [Gammaproteobacteria bacterium]|nr:alanine racemase [Gammaproteobacteria bacterium]
MNNEKKLWLKPMIKAHKLGVLNKFAYGTKKEFINDLEGREVNDLISEYGSPLFVLSESKLRQNVKRLMSAFKMRYPKVIYGWSYKTNYLSSVCNILHQEGAWAEVVSQFEYEKARQQGVPAEHILFNGLNKNIEILKRAVLEGARIHLDNLDEFYLLDSITKDTKKNIKVAMRLNFDTGFSEPWSRFGFNVENGQALDMAYKIANSDYLELSGLHSHIGTFVLDLRAYEAQMKIMCDFMHSIEYETDCVIDCIDIGGGFASKNSLQGSYLTPDQVSPEIEQYAQIICDTLINETKNRIAQGKPEITLIIESGRAIVDDAFHLITSVVSNKRLKDGRASLVVDAGVNILFTSFWYNHPISLTNSPRGVSEDTIIYGPLCMNIDVVRTHVNLPPLKIGDSLIISHVGAYNLTQSMQFIEYRPNVVMLHEEKSKVSLIKKGDDLHDMTRNEYLPEHLMINNASSTSSVDLIKDHSNISILKQSSVVSFV